MRGHPVTEREINSILRLLGYQNIDGDYVHTFESIAHLLDLDHKTVARIVRRSAIAWGRHTRWRRPDSEEIGRAHV